MTSPRYPDLFSRLIANSRPNKRRTYAGVCCREWTGNVNNSGYPRFTQRTEGGHQKVYAHRAALELKLGRALREGFAADHLCQFERCIEPAHLQEVTKSENSKLVHIRAAKAKAKGAQ